MRGRSVQDWREITVVDLGRIIRFSSITANARTHLGGRRVSLQPQQHFIAQPEYLQGTLIECFSGAGKLSSAASGSLKKCCPDFIFQFFEGNTDRWLRSKNALSGFPDAPFLNQSHKHLKLHQFHVFVDLSRIQSSADTSGHYPRLRPAYSLKGNQK